MIDYYDMVLGLIPLALFGVGGGLHISGFALTNALVIGGLVAAGLIGHAMFVNGPVRLNQTTQHTSATRANAQPTSSTTE